MVWKYTPIVKGGSFVNNKTLGTVNCNTGICISDVNSVTVTDNNLTTNLVNSSGLPLHRIVLLTNTNKNLTIQNNGTDTYSTTNASDINYKINNRFLN